MFEFQSWMALPEAHEEVVPLFQHLAVGIPWRHPRRGDIHVVGQPITMSRAPARVVSTLPEPGKDTAGILRSAGYTDVDIERFRTEKVV